MIRRSSKIIAIILLLVGLITVGGVVATWQFAGGNTQSQSLELTAEMGELDGGTKLLYSIIDLLNDGDSKLNDCIDMREEGNSLTSIIAWLTGRDDFATRKYYGSMDPQLTSYGYGLDTAVSEILSEYTDLSFIVYDDDSSDNTMYIFITDVYLGESGTMTGGLLSLYSNSTPGNPTVPIGENIYQIYRTTLTRADSTSDWEPVLSETGYAMSYWYEELRELTPIARQVPSYDVTTWQSGDLGDSASTAIWTFDGDTPQITVADAGTTVYYKMLIGDTTYTYNNTSYTYSYTAAGNYTISADNSAVSITVTASDNSESYTSTGGAVTFTATTGKTYYLAVSGSTDINLTVTKA